MTTEGTTRSSNANPASDPSLQGQQADGQKVSQQRGSAFSRAELAYLSGRRLGRLATIDDQGMPHVVPLGWTYNAALDTIDVGGHDFARTRKFRNVQRNPNVALVIDDVLPPWRPRCVMIRGHAEALDEAEDADGAIIRITPTQVISWGMEFADAE